MVDCRELRCGNKFIGIAGIQTVRSIIHHTDRYDYHSGEAKYGYEYLILVEENGNQYKPIEIEPMPLSPELLEACGFENDDTSDGYECWYPLNSDGDTMWSIRRWGTIGRYFLCVEVRSDEIGSFKPILEHLHQLQNLYYSLTQTELPIDISKLKIEKP